MKLTQEQIAEIMGITARTLRNWENNKPELMRLVKLGLSHDNLHEELFNRVVKNYYIQHNALIHFYMNFLVFFEKESLEFDAAIIYYILVNDIKDLMDEPYYDQEIRTLISRISRGEDGSVLFSINKDLSKYIKEQCKNNWIDFIKKFKDEQLTDVLNFTTLFIVYKFYQSETLSKQMKYFRKATNSIANAKNKLEAYAQWVETLKMKH